MPGQGRGLRVAGRGPGWQPEKKGRGFQSRGSREQFRCGRSILLRLVRSFPNIFFRDIIEVSGANVCINTIRRALGPNLRRKWRCRKRIRLQERDVKELLRIAHNYRQRDQELVEVCASISFPCDSPH